MKNKAKFIARKLFEFFVYFPIILFGVVVILVVEFFDINPDKWPRFNQFMDNFLDWADETWDGLRK